MSTPHEQYYDQDRYNRDFDTDDYEDPDDSMSLQDLAILRADWERDIYKRCDQEDLIDRALAGADEHRDFAEEAYNEWLMNGGDF